MLFKRELCQTGINCLIKIQVISFCIGFVSDSDLSNLYLADWLGFLISFYKICSYIETIRFNDGIPTQIISN
jgi:hypothetical protein